MTTFARILSYAKKYWYLMLFSFMLVIFDRFLRTYLPIIGTKAIIDVVLVQEQYNLLGNFLLMIIGIYSLKSLINFLQRYINSYLSQRVVFDIRNDLFASLQRKSFSFFDRTETGQLMSRTTTDVERIRRFYAFMITSLFGSILQVAIVVYFLIGMNTSLTLIATAILPSVFILNYIYLKRTRPIYQGIRHRFGVINSILQQNIVGMKVVRVFSKENLERDKFSKENREFFDLNVEAARQRSIYRPLSTFILSIIVALVYWYGGGEVVRNTMSLGSLLVYAQYMTMLTRPITFLGFIIGMYGRALAAAERIFEVLDEEPEIRDRPEVIQLPPIKGEVVFNDVSFQYIKEKTVLKNVSLSVKPGETIAILGATGSGKSTLIYLIPRFYEVTDGKIMIDGHDIRDVTLKSLRKHVGIVLQDIFLFSTTIKENIAFGKPNATMEEIVKAAKSAQAHDFITDFTDGYDTLVGERGVTLSGGQKQRIAIARTLLMNPRILIFDDSTSFVDTRTEQALQRAINNLLTGRTTFIITQRLSTIKNADRILVLDEGEIVEMGTHQELLGRDGIYSRIYRTQFSPIEEISLLKTTNGDYGG
jgi:ATP-binding cassette subfamily B protein